MCPLIDYQNRKTWTLYLFCKWLQTNSIARYHSGFFITIGVEWIYSD